MLVLALAFAIAAPAWAAKVVDVRVGRHDAFTRVVFELDGFAGYKIERNSPAPGIAELVVSLNAMSEERRVEIARALVESVDLQPEGAGSVARIRLAGEGVAMNLKQMTLADPPRIVLDVLGSSKPAAKKPATPAAKAPEKPQPVSQPEPMPEATSSDTAAAERGSASPDDDSAAEDDGSPGQMARAGSQPVAKPANVARKVPPSAPATPLPPPSTKPAQPIAKPAQPIAKPAQPIAKPAQPIAKPAQPIAKPADSMRVRPTPKPPAAGSESRAASRPSASLPPVPAKSDSGLDMMTLALAGVGLLVVGAGGFVFLRRRRGAAVAEALEGFDSDNPFAVEETAEVAVPSSGEGDDLFGSDGGEADPMSQPRFDVTAESDDQPVSRDTPAAGETGDLFQSSAAKAATGDASMDTQSADASATQFNPRAGAPMGGMGAGGDDATMTLVRELERRLSALEARFDEVVDAKERLERQVAAQTEELRVQRAAIARTQRAVRSMGRGGEEEAATEPALRDPSKPGGAARE